MAVEYKDCETEGRNFFWVYECTGEHEGSPIVCSVKNPRQEPSEGIAWWNYDEIEWTIPDSVRFLNLDLEYMEQSLGDPKAELEREASDSYEDAIREDAIERLYR
jgi:hypothetical protein